MTAASTPSPQRRACCGGECVDGGDDEFVVASTSTSSPPHATAGIRFRASLPAVLAKVLSMVALLTFLSAAVHDSSTGSESSARMLRKAAELSNQKPFSPPWFCHGRPCPPYDELESPSPSLYSVRKYRRGGAPSSPSSFSWARVANISASAYEAAYASGSLAIAAYSRGDNEESRKVPSSCFGLPTLVTFRPTDASFSRAEDRYDVSEFLVPQVDGEAVVPFPEPSPSTGVEVEEDDGGDETVYVVQFGGFATGRASLANAARLALALERDGLEYRGDVFLLASYDPPTRLAQRHNEVWLVSPREGGVGGGERKEATDGERSGRERKRDEKKEKRRGNRKSGGDDGGSASAAFAA